MSRQQPAHRDRSDSAQSSQSSRTFEAHGSHSEQAREQPSEKNISGWTKEDRERDRDRQWSSYAPLPAVKGTRGGIETPNRKRAQSPSLSNVGTWRTQKRIGGVVELMHAESAGRFLQSLTPGRIRSPPPQTPTTVHDDERSNDAGAAREDDAEHERAQQAAESNGRSTTTATATPAPRSRLNPNAPVFKSDATMKSSFDTCPLDARDRLKSMFLA